MTALGRRRALALVGAVVVVVAAAVVVDATREQVRLDDVAHRAAHRAAGDLQEVAAARSRTDILRRNIDAARRAQERHEDATVHIVTAIDELDSLRDRIELAELDLDRGRQVAAVLEPQLEVLRTCTQALEQARARLVGGDPAGANRSLAAAGSACQEAEAQAEGSTAAHPFDFPDPFVMRVGTSYFAFATNGAAGTIQVLESTGLDDWQVRGSALTSVAPWAQPGYTWAPSAVPTFYGYLLFYTVRDRATQRQCISRAVSQSPAGPYVDTSIGPLVCQNVQDGSIDPSAYIGPDGTLYLAWKTETTSGATELYAAPFTPDGATQTAPPSFLIGRDRGWEGSTVEGPSMALTGSGWVLLYSGNDWATGAYATGYARCDGPLGPCTKPADNVVLRSDGQREGPGGAEFFRTAGGQLKVAYAAWDAGEIGLPNPRRLLFGTASMTPQGLRIS